AVWRPLPAGGGQGALGGLVLHGRAITVRASIDAFQVLSRSCRRDRRPRPDVVRAASASHATSGSPPPSGVPIPQPAVQANPSGWIGSKSGFAGSNPKTVP